MNDSLADCPNWLVELIQEAGGTVAFSQFMDWALNAPNHGSYATGNISVGSKGDFVTSPSLGPEFCELLAVQVSDWILQEENSSQKNELISMEFCGFIS